MLVICKVRKTRIMKAKNINFKWKSIHMKLKMVQINKIFMSSKNKDKLQYFKNK